MKKEKTKATRSMFFRASLFVFATMFLSTMFVALIFLLFIWVGIISPNEDRIATLIIFIMLPSGIISSLLAALGFRKSLHHIDTFQDGMEEIRKGNYSVRVSESSMNERVRHLAENFNLMAHELSSVEALKSDFIGSFSHEFKTPITSIKGFAKLLKNPALSEEERKDYLDIIITESERLSRLASSTLDITKVENMESVAEKTKYRLDEQMRECTLLLEPRWNKKDLTVNAELEEVVFDGNEDLMRQVWINLIDNAVKFTQEKGRISVSLFAAHGNAIATISDNGCGMDENTQKRMFDKFFQADPSRSTEGNGVGLSLVKKIVSISEGEIRVKSTPGKGTCMTVILPLEVASE